MIGQEMDTGENGLPVVHFQPGDPAAGGWCVGCALPSLVRFPIYTLSRRGVTLWQIIEACLEDGMHKHLPGRSELLRFPE